MKLYSSPFSSNARKVRMAASMLGIPLDLVEVDLVKGAQRAPQFLAINPMGRVPVLEDGDFVLTESAAIMAYLADSKPGNALYPAERKARADVNRWLFWTGNHWGPAFGALAFENWLKKMMQLGEPDPAQVKRQADALHGFATVLDRHLASQTWVSGPATTIADLAIAASLGNAGRARFAVESFANLEAWFKRMQALEAWKATEPPAMPAAR
jgi:glutathione S-transferase